MLGLAVSVRISLCDWKRRKECNKGYTAYIRSVFISKYYSVLSLLCNTGMEV